MNTRAAAELATDATRRVCEAIPGADPVDVYGAIAHSIQVYLCIEESGASGYESGPPPGADCSAYPYCPCNDCYLSSLTDAEYFTEFLDDGSSDV